MLMLALLLVGTLYVPTLEVGMAGVYGSHPGVHDPWDDGRVACERLLVRRHGRPAYQRMLQQGLALREGPCGEEVKVCTLAGRCTKAYRVDSGPYGAIDRAGRYRVRRKGLLPGDRWRGLADLRWTLARQLGISGRAWVVIRRSTAATVIASGPARTS